jgi:hypothetical protein
MDGHVARIRDIRKPYKILVAKPYGKRDLKDLGMYGRIPLKRVFKKYDVEMCTEFIRLRTGFSGGRW